MLATDIQYLHGATPNDLLLGDFDVWVQDYEETQPVRFLGRTTHEKTIMPAYEYAEWWTGMPQARWAMHPIKIEFSVKFGLAQLGDPVAWALALDGSIDRTDPNTTRVTIGTNPSQPPDIRYWFIGELVDGRGIQFHIRRGRVINPEDIATGTGEYAVANVTVTAFQDDSICDEEDNLAYFCIENLEVPSGGYTDPCAAEVTPCEPAS